MLTADEVKDMLVNDNYYIRCANVEERDEVFRFLQEIGLKLGEFADDRVNGTEHGYHDPDSSYLHPGMGIRGTVTCFKFSVEYGKWIEFDEIIPLIRGGSAIDMSEFDAMFDGLFLAGGVA